MVAGQLARSGCAVLDLDRVAHEVMAPGGPAHAVVVAAFGPGVVGSDGTIDRKLLGARVFRERSELERLNAIVHPIVARAEARRVASLQAAGAEVVVSEAALLVETGLHLRFDRLIVAHCSPEQQRQRLERRAGVSPRDAAARLGAQMPAELKVRFAHSLVDTSASIEDTEQRATALAHELLALARLPGRSLPSRERLIQGLAIAARSEDAFATRFIEDVTRAGALDLRRIARVFGHSGEPWYQPQAGAGRAPLEAAVPVMIHLLQRPASDDDGVLASVMASMGRALCGDSSDWADACVFGLAAARSIRGETPIQGGAWREWIRLAEHWTGVAPRAASVAGWRDAIEGSVSSGPTPNVAGAMLRDLGAGAPWLERPTALGRLYERFLTMPR